MKATAALIVGLTTLGPISSPIWAQGPGPQGPRARRYDPHTVEVVSGQVASVERVSPGKGRSGGVHIALKTDGETIPVHLGPTWYVDKQSVHVERGDHIEVEGSRISLQGKPIIVARQVKKDGHTLTLRNEAGVPAWAGQGASRRPAD